MMATSNKYDRQLRLWGANGQAALSSAHVLLIGAGATGSECLKNLVLPGVGEITVVDDALVTEYDCRSNFFVRASDVGRPRAVVVCELLLEMNPDVRGQSRVCGATDLLSSDDPSFSLSQFTLVIGAQLEPLVLQELGDACLKKSVPLVVVRSCGLLGSVRLQLKRHEVLEARSQTNNVDLRLGSMKFSTTKIDRGTPYVVLLASAMEELGVPKTRQEKEAFTKRLEDKFGNANDNAREATREAYRVWASPSEDVPETVVAMSRGGGKGEKSPLARVCGAIVEFGRCPLNGHLPDMHADSFQFVAIQRAYGERAKKEVEAIHAKVPDLPLDFVDRVCRNARDLRLVETRSLADELRTPQFDLDGDETTQSPVFWYIALRCADRFFLNRKKWPSPQKPEDVQDLAKDCETFNIRPPEAWQKYAVDLARFNNSELHATASVIAAVASQEAVKIITQIYQPIDHTFFFNGVNSSAVVLSV